ncbi:serine hydrolase domain-containing protein [Paenibacillus antri]|nr:serine hydrolase domain-containing protein [Paenibacillus antri]
MKWICSVIAACVMFCIAAGPAAAANEAGTKLPLDRIDAYARAQFDIAGIPGGAYAIVDRGRIVQAQGIGFADLASRTEAGPDTVYAVASVTKPMTAAVVLQLAEEGRIDLDAPVKDYLPWFRYADEEASSKVTVRQLLTHSAGVNRFSADGAIYRDVKKNRNSLENAAKALENVRMNAEPGAKGQYCNTCYNLLGLIIEAATGRPYEAYMKERLFEPLGMTNASFRPPVDGSVRTAKEYGYLFGFPVEFEPYWKAFGSSQAPEGGAYASAADLARFAAAALGYGTTEPFFALGGLEPYHRAGVPASDLNGAVYAESGFEAKRIHGVPALEKSGEGMGSSSEIVLLPELGVGIVLLVGEADGEACGRIAEGIVSIVLGHPPETVEGLPNFLQLLGWVSLGLLLLGLVLFAGLIGSFVRLRRRRFETKRRWAVAARAVGFAVVGVPLWYLLFLFRPTEAGFYGYPYDFAVALIAVAVPFSLWAAYSAWALALGRRSNIWRRR